MKTLQAEWDRFTKEVYPDGIEGEQLRHVKQAFIAGSLSLLGVVGSYGMSEIDKTYAILKAEEQPQQENN